MLPMVNTPLLAAAAGAAAGVAGGRGVGRPPSAGNIPSTESSWSGATAALSRLLASERLSLSPPCDSQELAIRPGCRMAFGGARPVNLEGVG